MPNGATGGAPRGARGADLPEGWADARLEGSESAANGGGGQAAAARRRWADEEPPCDGDAAMGDEGSEYAEEDAAWEEEQEDYEECAFVRQPTAADLKSRWELECRAVRALEKVEKGGSEPSAALWAARNARDRAEKSWRDSLVARPVAVRMALAQKKVDRAQKTVDKARGELEEFEDEVHRRRCELQEALDHAEERLQVRVGHLDDLHREAGELAAANADAAEGRQGMPTADGAESLRAMLAGEFQVFIELLEEGTEAREKANTILAKLATLPTESGNHQQYNIHTDEEGADEDGGYQLVTRRGRTTAGGKGKGTTRPRAEPVWTSTANGRWNRQRPSGTGDAPLGDAQGASSSNIGSTASGGQDAAALATARTEDRQRSGPSVTAPAAQHGGNERSGKGKRAAEDGGGQEAQRSHGYNKSHRGSDNQALPAVEGNGDDAGRALKLHQEQEAATEAAKAANATFGDQTSMQIAGQLYAHKVDLIKARAVAAGITPLADGRELLQLAPAELNAWVEGVLTRAEKQGEQDDQEEKDL